MKILSIPFNYDELKKDLKKYSEKYTMSVGARELLNGKDPLPLYSEDRNKKWIIYLFDEGFVGYSLYETHCLNYLEKLKAEKN